MQSYSFICMKCSYCFSTGRRTKKRYHCTFMCMSIIKLFHWMTSEKATLRGYIGKHILRDAVHWKVTLFNVKAVTICKKTTKNRRSKKHHLSFYLPYTVSEDGKNLRVCLKVEYWPDMNFWARRIIVLIAFPHMLSEMSRQRTVFQPHSLSGGSSRLTKSWRKFFYSMEYYPQEIWMVN